METGANSEGRGALAVTKDESQVWRQSGHSESPRGTGSECAKVPAACMGFGEGFPDPAPPKVWLNLWLGSNLPEDLGSR